MQHQREKSMDLLNQPDMLAALLGPSQTEVCSAPPLPPMESYLMEMMQSMSNSNLIACNFELFLSSCSSAGNNSDLRGITSCLRSHLFTSEYL